MSIAIASRIRNEMCYIEMCIDAYDDGEIRGRLYNAYFQNAILFDNFMELIKEMDAVFNTFGYPHATMETRRFDLSIENVSEEDEEELDEEFGEDEDDYSVPEGAIKLRDMTVSAETDGTSGSVDDESEDEEETEGPKYSETTITKFYGDRESVTVSNENLVFGKTYKEKALMRAPTVKLVKHNVKGNLATLKVRVMFRQNASWQGSVKWVEEDLTEEFQSMLELMMLINSLFEDDQKPDYNWKAEK